MDEYRHASEKAKKQENVIEKYKKKLEEAAETKRMLKVRRLALVLEALIRLPVR